MKPACPSPNVWGCLEDEKRGDKRGDGGGEGGRLGVDGSMLCSMKNKDGCGRRERSAEGRRGEGAERRWFAVA